MKDILFLLAISLAGYILVRILLKEPIRPWKEKKASAFVPKPKKKNKKNKLSTNPLEEEEAAPFSALFPNVKTVANHMIHFSDNRFVMMAEVESVNYFLLDEDEQEAIDTVIETWTAQISYDVRQYLQNRFVDLTEPILEIKKTMEREDTLNEEARTFGQNMIRDLESWQKSTPRYDTKRYILFEMQVDPNDIKLHEEDDMQERIIDKAFQELYRRVTTAKNQLRRADVFVELLSTDGICEVLYYTFNRRKALKNRYSDIEEHEMLSLYVTADTPTKRIIKVRGELERVQKEEREKSEQAAG